MSSVLAALERTRLELAEAGREARRAWSPRAWVALAALAAAAAFPAVASPLVSTDALADTAYLALAAVGLGFALGVGGMPSLAHGAFVGVGAVVAAHLAGAGSDAAPAALAGAGAAGLAGLAVGLVAARLRPVHVAVATWVATWLFSLGLAAFPSLGGGSRGLVVPPGRLLGAELTPTLHYELALALLALALLGHAWLARSAFGVRLRATKEGPAAAAALAVPRTRLRLRAFAGSASLAGLAGALAVQLAAVADPSSYGPSLSFRLLVAVLVGGAASALGPPVGAIVVSLLGPLGDAVGRAVGADEARFGAMFAALLVLLVLALGGDGVVPPVLARLRRRGTIGAPPARAAPPSPPPATLAARGLGKRFGSLVALERLDLDVAAGRITALVGPNGSGKTTALRVLSGAVRADSGAVRLDGRELADASPDDRARAGIVRTLQPNAVFPRLTVLENALAGAALRASGAGGLRTLLATPRARAEERRARAAALAALAAVGLEERAGRPAGELPGTEQRLLMIASALATGPRVLLLDEPAAGAGPAELERLARVLEDLRDSGFALLIVEHNLRLVRAVADHVLVLEAGSVLAEGPPHEVATAPEVRAAYLGRARL